MVLLILNGGLFGLVIFKRTSSQKQRWHCIKSSILEREILNGAVCPGLYGMFRSCQYPIQLLYQFRDGRYCGGFGAKG